MQQIIFDQPYYQSLIKKYKYNPLEFRFIDFSIAEMQPENLRRRWLCHNGADAFSRAFLQGEKCIVSTGFGMSGVPHLGTITQIFNALELQKNKMPVNMVLGDLDAYNGKNISLSYAVEMAAKYKNFINNLGFSRCKLSYLRSQYDDTDVLRTSYLIGRYMDDKMFELAEEDLHGFYSSQGKIDTDMSYRRKLSLNLMTADFINLTLREKFTHVLVALGIDEHKYVRFASDTLVKMRDDSFPCDPKASISAIYTKILKGFNNYPKMSKSFPDSSVDVSTTTDKMAELFFEGEGHYATPTDNVIFQMMSLVSYFSADEIHFAYEACHRRDKEWTKYKLRYIDMLAYIFSLWNK